MKIFLSVAMILAAGLGGFQAIGWSATAPSLGTAESFAVLGGTTVTNTGFSALTGDLGVSPGTALTGFPPGTVTGTKHSNDAVAISAQSDVTTAYNDLAGWACDSDLTGQDLGGMTLWPGVYCFSDEAHLTGTLTLNGGDDPQSVWVFQIGTTLITASSSSVLMINGGQDCNVFWQVGSSATLGLSTAFIGNILADQSISLTTSATMSGRALARIGAVTLDTNEVTVAICAAIPTPSVTPTPSVIPTPSVTPTPDGYKTPLPTPSVAPTLSVTPTPSTTPIPSITPTPSLTPSPTPLNPALELVKTVNEAPDGTVDINQPCFEPTYYYMVTNTGDTYLSDIEVRDDNGTPEEPSAEILIGVIPGPLGPGESAGLEYISDWVAVRFNRAIATGIPTDSGGIAYPGIAPVSDEDTAITFTLVNTDGNDYDGDGRSDITTFKCGEWIWYIQLCPYNDSQVIYFGSNGDLPAPGDYDADGLTDVAIFRPSNGLWAVRDVTRFYFGGSLDHAVPADYSGDGRTDAGIFRRSTGLWAIRGLTRVYFGGLLDLPVPGVYDSGSARIGIFRPSSGLWAIRGLTRRYFGIEGDYPVRADYTGDGLDEIGIFRDRTGLWAISGVTRVYFGRRFDFPQPMDYTGDGTDRITIYRPSNGLWAIRGVTRKYWGGPNAYPISW